MDECDSWSKGEDTLEALATEMDGFAAQPTDILSENMLLDDAPLEQDNIPSISILHDLHSISFKSTTRDPNQDPARRSYRGYSLSLSVTAGS
jgi:hypothetical protein